MIRVAKKPKKLMRPMVLMLNLEKRMMKMKVIMMLYEKMMEIYLKVKKQKWIIQFKKRISIKRDVNDDCTRPSKDLQPNSIDAFWLQRNLSKVYAEATDAQLKAQKALEIRKTATNDRELENKLVILFVYDQFDFIKTLQTHRQMILYCTLLASSQSTSKKAKIEEKLRNDQQLLWILQALSETDRRDTAQDDRDRRVSSRKSRGEDGDQEAMET
jgi:hypothetical protein